MLARRKKERKLLPKEKLPLKRRRPDSNRGNNGFAIRRLRPLGYGAFGEADITKWMCATDLSHFIGQNEVELHRKAVEIQFYGVLALFRTILLPTRFARRSFCLMLGVTGNCVKIRANRDGHHTMRAAGMACYTDGRILDLTTTRLSLGVSHRRLPRKCRPGVQRVRNRIPQDLPADLSVSPHKEMRCRKL